MAFDRTADAASAQNNGSGSRLEAITRSAFLAAIGRLLLSIGMTAVIAISEFEGVQLLDLKSAIAAHTEALNDILRRLSRIEERVTMIEAACPGCRGSG